MSSFFDVSWNDGTEKETNGRAKRQKKRATKKAALGNEGGGRERHKQRERDRGAAYQQRKRLRNQQQPQPLLEGPSQSMAAATCALSTTVPRQQQPIRLHHPTIEADRDGDIIEPVVSVAPVRQ